MLIFIYLFGCTGFYRGMWDLVPWPGIELGSPPWENSLSHWSTKGVPHGSCFENLATLPQSPEPILPTVLPPPRLFHPLLDSPHQAWASLFLSCQPLFISSRLPSQDEMANSSTHIFWSNTQHDLNIVATLLHLLPPSLFILPKVNLQNVFCITYSLQNFSQQPSHLLPSPRHPFLPP